MNCRWLLAAEVDKIQDFVFRSSRLVEVAGGSGLLARFCATVPRLLMAHQTGQPAIDADVVVSAGGGFRLVFDDPGIASAVGRDLAELYYRATNGSLTIAEPQAYVDAGDAVADTFKEAVEKADAALRLAKIDRRDDVSAVAHLPYVAFCSSCGLTLATEWYARHNDQRPNYHCRSCVQRESERDMAHEAPREERFFAEYVTALRRTPLAGALPESPTRGMFPRDADEISRHDARGNVAYLIADGNGMGELFGRCADPHTMHRLSEALSRSMWDAVATATARMMAPAIDEWRRAHDEDTELTIPVMPLIVGGDDLFALVPAPYALDFAQEVCRTFEAQLAAEVRDLGIQSGARPTMAAAVVVCKKGYPYALAHRRGEDLLRRAKRHGRRALIESGVDRSLVDFTIVHGSDIAFDANDGAATDGVIQATARPYWVIDDGTPEAAIDYGLALQRLLDVRYALRGLPGKRRAELRELFVRGLPPGDQNPTVRVNELRSSWRPRLEALVKRVGHWGKDGQSIADVIATLGDPNAESGWRKYRGRERTPFAHGLLDLLTAWDFALALDRPKSAYEEET